MVILEFLAGIVLLAFGADRFLKSSQAIAWRLGLSATITGVVLVGFGTSFAEIVVAAVAAAHQQSLLAVGNVLGSNIANIGLVVGVATLLQPLSVSAQFVKKEFPALLAVTVLVGVLLWHGFLGRVDGVILLLLLVLHLWVTFRWGPKDSVLQAESQQLPQPIIQSIWLVGFFWLLGLGLLYISSEMIVSSASAIARWLQISELTIGLTVVAVGTSLPELATIVLSMLRKEHDIAIGSILGSNIFNLLAVLAMPALISPVRLPRTVMHIDYPIVLAFTLLFWVFAVWPKRQKQVSRIEGVFLVLAYAAYIVMMAYR